MTIETVPLSRTDVILTISEGGMQRIVSGEKNHDFQRYLLPNSVKRVWFFVRAPTAQITHVCEIDSAIQRPSPYSNMFKSTLFPLPLDGIGNEEFNLGEDPAMEGLSFAYFIRGVYRLTYPVTLSELKKRYMLGGTPKGPVFAPERMLDDVDLLKEEKILERASRKRAWETKASVVGATSGWVWTGGETTVVSSGDEDDSSMDVDEVVRGTKRALEDALYRLPETRFGHQGTKKARH